MALNSIVNLNGRLQKRLQIDASLGQLPFALQCKPRKNSQASYMMANGHKLEVTKGSQGVCLSPYRKGYPVLLGQKRCNKQLKATLDHVAADDDCNPISRENGMTSFSEVMSVLYKFTRPYALLGTILPLISTSLLAVNNISDITPFFLARVLEGTIAVVLMVITVIGVNQICDMEIDKINKPYLPLATGELSLANGILFSLACTLMSLLVAWRSGSSYLFLTVFAYLLWGLLYSVDLPMLRWKKTPLLATLSIIGGRATCIHIGFFLHIQNFVLGRLPNFTSAWTLAMVVSVLFSVVSSLFKDIPDIEGDLKNGIQNAAYRLGKSKVLWLCVSLLQVVFILAMWFGVQAGSTWSKYFMVVGNAVLSLMLWQRAKSLDLHNEEDISSFYMFIWQLMYAQYIMVPFLR